MNANGLSSVITNGLLLNNMNALNGTNASTGNGDTFSSLLTNVMGNNQTNANLQGTLNMLGGLPTLNTNNSNIVNLLLSNLYGINQGGNNYSDLISALKELQTEDDETKNSSIDQLLTLLKSGNLSIGNDQNIVDLINNLGEIKNPTTSTNNVDLSNIIKNSIMYSPVVDPKNNYVSDDSTKTGFDAMNLPPDVLERIKSTLAQRDAILDKIESIKSLVGNNSATVSGIDSLNAVSSDSNNIEIQNEGINLYGNIKEVSKITVDGAEIAENGLAAVDGMKTETTDFIKDKTIVNITDESSQLRSSVVEQIKEQISFMKTNGKQTVTMQLQPETLGKLDIKMVFDKGNLAVEILTSTAKAQELIMSNMDELKAILQSSLVSDRYNTVNYVEGKNQQQEQQAFYNQQQNQEQQQQHNNSQYENQKDDTKDAIGDFDFYEQLSMLRR